jgi:hypothetical protein
MIVTHHRFAPVDGRHVEELGQLGLDRFLDRPVLRQHTPRLNGTLIDWAGEG